MLTDTNCDTASSRSSVIQRCARRGKEVLVSFTKQCQVGRCETCVVFSDRRDIVAEHIYVRSNNGTKKEFNCGRCSLSTCLDQRTFDIVPFWVAHGSNFSHRPPHSLHSTCATQHDFDPFISPYVFPPVIFLMRSLELHLFTHFLKGSPITIRS